MTGPASLLERAGSLQGSEPESGHMQIKLLAGMETGLTCSCLKPKDYQDILPL